MHHSRSSFAMENSIHAISQRTAETDDFVDAVSQELLCVVCGSVLIDPRVLRCQHCFCLRCLFATVMHDRGSHVTVHCAYRCPEVTVTEGDIRTLPRNTVITNVAQLIRDRTRRRCLAPQSPAPRAERGAAATEATGPVTTTGNAATTGESVECEWCGVPTAPVTWCPHCLSLVCETCNGVFEDHYFLCTEPHTQKKGTIKGRGADGAASALTEEGGDQGETAQAVAAARNDATRSPLPFLFPMCSLELLLQKALRSAQTAAQKERGQLQVTLDSVRPVRLTCDRREVCYSHEVFGTLCSYGVIPDGLTPFGKTLITPADVQWCAADRGTSSLLFASNLIELTGQFLNDLATAHTEVELARLELKSAARQAFVRHNLGFQAVVLHLVSQYRNVVRLTQNCVVPCLERGRAIEGLMGDVVVSQFYQQWSQGSPMERKVVQDRVATFLQTEMKLCASMDDMIEKLGEACQTGVRLVEKTLCEVNVCMRESVDAEEAHRHNLAKCDHAQRRLLNGSTTDVLRPSDQARVAKEDPIFNTYVDRTFSGQWRDKDSAITALRSALIGGLLHLSKLRHWVWDYTNTSVRDCGISPEEQTTLIEKEETIQKLIDRTLQACADHEKGSYAWQVLLNQLESSKTPVTRDAVAAICLYESHNVNSLYSCENTLALFSKLQDLRAYLFQQSSNPAHVIQTRTFQRQEEIIEVMKTVISECMEEQTLSLQLIALCEEGDRVDLDSALSGFAVPPSVTQLPERQPTDRTDLEVLYDLIHMTDAEKNSLSEQLPASHCVMAVDQYIRQLALHRSATFGGLLIDAAHGRARPDDTAHDASFVPTAGSSAAVEQTPGTQSGGTSFVHGGGASRTTPFVRSVPLTPSQAVTTVSPLMRSDGRVGMTAAVASEAGLELPVSALAAQGRPRGRLLSSSSFSSVDSGEEGTPVVAGDGNDPTVSHDRRSSSDSSTHREPAIDPAAIVSETLFAASDEPSSVARVELTPKASDPQGYAKAVTLFSRHYRFNTVETTTTGIVPQQLPFFEGVVCAVTPSGETCRQRFLVDAQTGETYLQKSDTAGKRTSLTTFILMSPFVIFALFNLSLQSFLPAKSTHVGWS